MCPLPASSTIAQYDGDNKINNMNLPPANQSLDWSNPLLAACTSDVAGLVQTGPRVIVRMTLAATTGALVLNSWRAVWQNVSVTQPVLSRTSTGIFTITLPTTVSDEYDASLGTTNNITVNLGYAHGNIEVSSTIGFISCSAVANVITVKTFNINGSANDLATDVVTIYGYSLN